MSKILLCCLILFLFVAGCTTSVNNSQPMPQQQVNDTGTQSPITTQPIAEPATPLPTANVTTTREQDPHTCPAFLVNPPEFSCPREMQPLPETHAIADPDHPTQKEIDAIPVDFPGVDRMTLIDAAFNDPCVKEFLKSGGVIEGITDQPRPLLNQTETVRWPPTLMADRWINCTDLRVFFDIDPSAGRVTRIWGETL
ncbi:hypothetical protein [Methanoregula sp. UBA64]|jgi:hypothetical protein|uniref:hypothetical protein n=1 Tax=Methanoregula sp. UBA64 TaxID=1915554 RepID=UPI0025DD2142|nr:hypothetical protein [Methanoregula sp. UBA64]